MSFQNLFGELRKIAEPPADEIGESPSATALNSSYFLDDNFLTKHSAQQLSD